MALSNPLIRNVLGRYVYPVINTARNLFSDTGRILTTLALFAKSITLGCGSNFFPSIIEEMRMKLNSDTETISKIFKIFAIMSMVGSISGIFIFKKIRRQLGTMYILVGISVSMIMIPNCPGVDSFFIAIGIFGALVGMIVPGQIVWTMEMWQKQSTPILQALMFFFSIGMTLPEYITAPFLKPVLLNATDLGELGDLQLGNDTSLEVPVANKTIGQFLESIKDTVVQANANAPAELSNIHIPFAIVAVMSFFNAWFERLLFKHYTYAPPPPPTPPPKPGEEAKAAEDKTGLDDKKKDKDPKAMAMKQLKNLEMPQQSEDEEELGEEEEEEDDDEENVEDEEDEDTDDYNEDAKYDSRKDVHESEESEDKGVDDEDDDDDDDDNGGTAENEKMPMLKRQASEKIPTIRKQMPMLKKHQSMFEEPAQKMNAMLGRRTSMTLPGAKQVVAEVRKVTGTLPPSKTAKENKSISDLGPTTERKQSIVKQSSEEKMPSNSTSPSSKMLSEKKPSISRGTSSDKILQEKKPSISRGASFDKSLEKKPSISRGASSDKILEEKSKSLAPAETKTKPSEPRESRKQSTLTEQVIKEGINALRQRSTSRTRTKRKKSRNNPRKPTKRPSVKKSKKEKQEEKEEVEEVAQDDPEEDQDDYEDIDADLGDEPLLPSAGESEKEGGGIDLFNIHSDDDTETGNQTGMSTRASTLGDNNEEDYETTGDTEEVSEFSEDDNEGVSSIAPPTTVSSRENMLSDTEKVSSKASVKSSKDKLTEEVKASDKEESVKGEDATPRSTLSGTGNQSMKKKKKDEREEPIVEKDKVTATSKEAPIDDKKKEEDTGGASAPPTGKGKKSTKDGDDDEEIKAVEKETPEAPGAEAPAEGGDDAEGGNPVQKIIKKIMGIKKIGIALWNMLRDPDQRRGLIVIALSSVFFGAYAAIEKCSKDLIPGLGQDGNLKLDDEGGALVLKGFTMAFMIGRLAGMVISLKISPFLLLCSDLALVFLGNFMLIFGASFSEHIMLVGSVLIGLGLSTIYAGLFTYLCGVVPFTDAVGSILIVASTIATSVYANFIEGFISGSAQRLTSANYISGLACTLAFKLIYSITKPKKPPPPPLEHVVSLR